MMSRPELRTEMRRRRRALSDAQRLVYAEQLAQQFTAMRVFHSSRRIACYYPYDGEIDTMPLLQRAWAMQKTCYLPILNGLMSQPLWFAPYHAGDRLVYNRFGILQPCVPAREWVRARSLDLILAPVVAFDQRGNRLGTGGGFYDRTLSFLRQRRSWYRPRVFGLAYDFQKVRGIQAEPWDVPLQGVVTQARIYVMGTAMGECPKQLAARPPSGFMET